MFKLVTATILAVSLHDHVVRAGYMPMMMGGGGGGGGMMGGGMMGGGGGMMGGGGGMMGGGAGMMGGGAGMMGGGGGMMGGGGGMMGGGGGMMGGGMMGGGMMGGGGGGMMMGGMGGYGGGEVSKGAYNHGKKDMNDLYYKKAEGKEGGEYDKGEAGYHKGELAHKDVKADSGYYNDVNGGKKLYEDGKQYHGAKHYDKEGKKEGMKNMKKGYKKGHKVKGFKNSHQKEESGKTEEYYDEDHDEAGNYMYNGEKGAFGEKGASSFKGGKEEGKFKAGEAKKEGHFGSKYLEDKEKGQHGRYGEGKFGKDFAAYGLNNGGGMHKMMGHHEASKFFKKHPFYHWYY